MEYIRLMHGTCSCCAESIKSEFLCSHSYLTDSEEVAEYYASCAMDECDCGDYEILYFNAPINSLRVDVNSYAEPLSYFRNEYTTSDREWLKMVECGDIPYPKEECDFQSSLEVVRSVICTIPLNVDTF